MVIDPIPSVLRAASDGDLGTGGGGGGGGGGAVCWTGSGIEASSRAWISASKSTMPGTAAITASSASAFFFSLLASAGALSRNMIIYFVAKSLYSCFLRSRSAGIDDKGLPVVWE